MGPFWLSNSRRDAPMRRMSASSTSMSAPSRPATRAWPSSGCWFTCDLHNRSFHAFGGGIRRAFAGPRHPATRGHQKDPGLQTPPPVRQGNAGRQPCRPRDRLSPFPGSRGVAETENRIRQYGAPEPELQGVRGLHANGDFSQRFAGSSSIQRTLHDCANVRRGRLVVLSPEVVIRYPSRSRCAGATHSDNRRR